MKFQNEFRFRLHSAFSKLCVLVFCQSGGRFQTHPNFMILSSYLLRLSAVHSAAAAANPVPAAAGPTAPYLESEYGKS